MKKPLWIEVMAWKLWKEIDLQNHDKNTEEKEEPKDPDIYFK